MQRHHVIIGAVLSGAAVVAVLIGITLWNVTPSGQETDDFKGDPPVETRMGLVVENLDGDEEMEKYRPERSLARAFISGVGACSAEGGNISLPAEGDYTSFQSLTSCSVTVRSPPTTNQRVNCFVKLARRSEFEITYGDDTYTLTCPPFGLFCYRRLCGTVAVSTTEFEITAEPALFSSNYVRCQVEAVEEMDDGDDDDDDNDDEDGGDDDDDDDDDSGDDDDNDDDESDDDGGEDDDDGGDDDDDDSDDDDDDGGDGGDDGDDGGDDDDDGGDNSDDDDDSDGNGDDSNDSDDSDNNSADSDDGSSDDTAGSDDDSPDDAPQADQPSNNVPALVMPTFATCDCGKPRDTRIVGGEDAEENEYPFAASLLIDGRVLCGGALVSDQFVLTAAHCVMSRNNVQVRLGTNFRSNLSGVLYLATQIITHPLYNSGTLQYDAALLRIPTVDFNILSLIRPVCLPTGSSSYAGTNASTIGWGRLSDGQLPTRLQEAHVPVYSNMECRQLYGSIIRDNHICSGEDGKSACVGDSGSPLLHLTSGNYHEVIGVTSFVRAGGCAQPDSPAVYTRVTSVMSWIIENINQSTTCSTPT